MRLRQLREELPTPVELGHRAFVLREEEGGQRHFTEYHLRHRRAARDMTGLPFDLPEVGAPYPSSSWPALEAAEWVKRRHPERFDAFDLALFEAFFRETRDISSTEVLVDLAERCGIPAAELPEVLRTRQMREAVRAEFHEALHQGVTSIPTVFIGDRAISGAVPLAEYQAAARDWLGR